MLYVMFYNLQIYHDSVEFQESVWDFFSPTNGIYVCVGSLNFLDLIGYYSMN